MTGSLNEMSCTLYLWDSPSGELSETFDVCASVGWLYRPIVFSPDGESVLTVSTANRHVVEIFNLETQDITQRFATDGESIGDLAFSPDGRYVAASTSDNTVWVWDIASGAVITRLIGHDDLINAVSFSPDGQSIVTASHDRTARVWDVARGQERRRLIGHRLEVWSAVYSPDGLTIVTASADMTARIWDAHTGEEIHRLDDVGGQGINAMYSPDGDYLLTATYFTDTVRIWDVRTWEVVDSFRHSEPQYGHLQTALFSPNGQTILTVAGNVVKIWAFHPAR